MTVFHFNIPWIINQSEYNCSSRSLSEWESRGTMNYVQGVYLIVSGTFFVILYVLCLMGMLRGNLLKTPCYRLMFFNGIIDIMDLFVASFITAYFHFTGAVFCSSISFGWFVGYLSSCVWIGASFNCIILALNRVVEMIPWANGFCFLFRGKLLFFWMLLSIAYMTTLPFITRPHPYNSVIATYTILPMISDDIAQGRLMKNFLLFSSECYETEDPRIGGL
ncbi:hypothetical protein GCK32_017650 [Trichostrongylus colubriformis]|uniref:Uncharacterized protein n=1 Tax=Trichostrongylus colubriformis TaxID=6319 RepID=A0AAN8FLQ7_TRICO